MRGVGLILQQKKGRRLLLDIEWNDNGSSDTSHYHPIGPP
jgi:hypothetical protein